MQKLIKAKYQDNLEFLQWIKRYYDLHYPGGKYNAVERRAQSKCPYEGDGKASADQNTAPAAHAAHAAHKPAAKTEGKRIHRERRERGRDGVRREDINFILLCYIYIYMYIYLLLFSFARRRRRWRANL